MPKVTISAEQKVRYSQVRNISDATWSRYQAILAEYEDASRPVQRDLDRELEGMAELAIDFGDVLDADELQDIEIELCTDED